MEKIKKILRSPGMTAALFIAAAVLLFTGGIGGARAALTYMSDYYVAQVDTAQIDTVLTENGSDAGDALLGGIRMNDAGILPGKAYDEALAVRNSGSVDEYVRVSVYKYWTKADGTKDTTLSPELIDLHFTEGSGWIADESASTDERTVLYYTKALGAGQTAPAFTDTLTISNELASQVTMTETGGVYTVTYDYDGAGCGIEVDVDAVQTHNAENAILSAWGVRVTETDGSISLRQ